MATGVYTWSETAATNATADPNVNWVEGMAPSQVNDSARAMMASVARFNFDTSGNMTTAGGNVAFTVTTGQGFSSLAAMDSQTLGIRMNVTNGANPTLSVDGLTAKPFVIDGFATAVAAGALRQASIHKVTYDNVAGAFIVHMGHSLVEPGRIVAHGMTSAPPGWLLCDGTGVSRVTFADLFANISTTFGSSDGASFKVPDLRDKVAAGKGSGSILSFSGSLGSTGGAASQTIAQANLPNVNFNPNTPTATSVQTNIVQGNVQNIVTGGGLGEFVLPPTPSSSTITVTLPTYASGGSGTALATVQPTLIVNYFIKT